MKNIFISSTFRDMQAERDLVQERVLPALREEARKYGDNVGVIDLRWGVDTSTLETEEGAAKVLNVCLDEIDRSHPYMLIFLGERYGWIPEGKLIERAVRGREDKYVTDDYSKSVTALEIEYGALSEKYGELNHCVVCFREPVVHMLDGAEKDLYAEHIRKGKKKLRALKKKIKKGLGKDDRLITYSCTWDKSARQLVDFASNGQPLEHVLTNCFVEMFRDDWKEYESLSWQDKEQLAFRALMESKLRSFVGREALLEEYYQSAINGTCPIILQGETGSGKTAIMCKLVERLQKEGKNVFAFFSGAGSMSTNAESLVKQMVYYVENLLGIEEHFGEREEEKDETDDVTEKRVHTGKKKAPYDDWKKQLMELCSQLPERGKVYFCIDAMDQLLMDEHVEELDFFVSGKHVQMIASCTDEFEFSYALGEVKSIPTLSKEDAKMVAEGILASYSRNAYVAIEEEILKKKGIGTPLYISLLIQRLNMMDTEELRKAMNEKEIVALGTRIIRDMPEETEAAIVAIIQNGIDKIGESEERLYEVLEYLAVSRNGLRMSDLQGIFAEKERTLPVLGFTLLMKYLDSFFYMHEDERIDFTHKVIRQGLLKGLADREVKEEAIKEHIKVLDALDSLLISEGMHFACIRKDEEFAKRLIEIAYFTKIKMSIEQAYVSVNKGLEQAIMNEEIADDGRFYCRLIEKETDEESIVFPYFRDRLLKGKGFDGEVMLKMGEVLVANLERLHEKSENICILGNLMGAYEAMGDLSDSKTYYKKMIECMDVLYEKPGSEIYLDQMSTRYYKAGYIFKDLSQPREALSCYEKAIKCDEKLYDGVGMSMRYEDVGNIFKDLGQPGKALTYYEKGIKCAEESHEKEGDKYSLNVWFDCYMGMCDVLEGLNPTEEVLAYHEKGIKCAESRYEMDRNLYHLEGLKASYNSIAKVLIDLGRFKEAQLYFDKELECDEKKYEDAGNEARLQILTVYNHVIAEMFRDFNQMEIALSYYKKSLKYNEELYEKYDESSLKMLLFIYKDVYDTLRELCQPRETLSHYEKKVDCNEEMYEMSGSDRSLQDLIDSYRKRGDEYRDLGQEREALTYYEKAIKCEEEMHEKLGSDTSLMDLSLSYNNMGNVLIDLGHEREALMYYKKALGCAEELREKSRSKESFKDLSISYDNMGDTLKGLGHEREALRYYEKARKCAKTLQEKSGSEESLQDLSLIYSNMGNALKDLGQSREALSYYEKALKCKKDLYEKSESEESLRDLSISYNNMGNALKDLGQVREALSYYEKALKCKEELHEKSGSENSLRDLSISYNYMGCTLYDLGRYEEASEYLAKNMRGREELYRLSANDSNLSGLSLAYSNYGIALCEIGKSEEAVEYLEKALQYTEELHRKNPTKNTKSSLASRQRNLARALRETDQLQEALAYEEKALVLNREAYDDDTSDRNRERIMKSLNTYAETLFADNQTEEAYKMYSEAMEHCKSVCEKNDSIPNARIYVKTLKGLYLCLHKMGQSAEAEEYLLLAKEEAKKLYERSGAEKDKELLEELLSY